MSELASTSATQKKYGGRNEILGRSGKLAEREVDADGVTYIVRELTGLERAAVIGLQAQARINGKVDLEGFTKELLRLGVVDPTSPEGAREPAFTDADMDTVMRNGAGFLEKLTEAIEDLSGLGVDAKQAAKDFLGGTQSEPSTSDSPES